MRIIGESIIRITSAKKRLIIVKKYYNAKIINLYDEESHKLIIFVNYAGN
jgi:hypothetical protein